MSENTQEETEAQKKFREEGEKLVAEKKAKEEEAKKTTELAVNSLSAIQQNAELAKMYSDNAQVGAENLSGESPLLKVHAVGRSTKNELSDGTEPNDGWFFYKPTGEQFETVRCHILTISRGFRAEGMEEKGKETRSVFNQIVSGVIMTEGEMKPFILYMTGLKLKNLWEFGKEAAKYTRAKPVSIPMFALTVKLTTEKVANSYGKSWVINFEIEKSADGTPVLVLDPGEFQYLKDHVDMVQDTISRLIAVKTATTEDDGFPNIEAEENKAVEPDDIPF